MAHFKVLEDKIKELENYRFHPLNDEYKEENDIDEDDPIFHMDGYVYSIGHSRRGQYYYYIVEKSGLFTIYASKADGDGSNLALDDTFMKLLNDGILTLYGQPIMIKITPYRCRYSQPIEYYYSSIRVTVYKYNSALGYGQLAYLVQIGEQYICIGFNNGSKSSEYYIIGEMYKMDGYELEETKLDYKTFDYCNTFLFQMICDIQSKLIDK